MNLRRLSDERGAALVEMAIVLPLLLLVLFGIIEFGLVLQQSQVLSNAAREGARVGSVRRTTPPCTAAGVQAEVIAAVLAYANAMNVIVDAGDITVEAQVGGALDSDPEGLCGKDNTVSVTVTSDYTWVVMPGFIEALSPTLTLVGRSAMRNE